MNKFPLLAERNQAAARSRYSAALRMMFAGALIGLGNLPYLLGKARKERRPYPTMVCSTPGEIAAWNREVERKKRAKLAAKLARRAGV